MTEPPMVPMMSEEAILFLQNILDEPKDILELGGGRSTIWFALQGHRVTTLENNAYWRAHKLLPWFSKYKVEVNLQFSETYWENIPDEEYDVVLIDGGDRYKGVENSILRVKSGGWLVLDDAERRHTKPRYAEAVSLLQSWNLTYVGPDNHQTLFAQRL